MMKKILFLFFLSFALSVSAAPIKVLASFSILADMAKEVGGEEVAVDVLIGRDTEAHGWQPKPLDAKRLAASELFLLNGLGFEGWMARLVSSSGFAGKEVIATARVTPLTTAEGADPHAWLDMKNALLYVDEIAAAFIQKRPEKKAFFQANASAYQDKIKAMDAAILQKFASLPQERRKIITSHDALAYFARAYGLQVFSPSGFHNQAESSAKTMKSLIVLIRQENIRAGFFENTGRSRLIEGLQKETKLRVGKPLFLDALSLPKTPAETYLGMMQANLDAILEIL